MEVPRNGRPHALRLHRLALVRLSRRWPMSVALGVALSLAVALPTTVALVSAITAEAGLQDTVRELGPDRYLVVDQRNLMTVYDYSTAGSRAAAAVGQALGSLERLRHVRLQSDQLVVEGASQSVVRLTSIDDLDRHVDFVQGRALAPARTGDVWSITAPEGAVRTLGLTLGRVTCFDSLTIRENTVRLFCAQLAGVWRARDPHDHFWAERPVPDSVVTTDPLTLTTILHPDPKSRALSPASATLFFEPDASRLHQDRAASVLAGFRRLRSGSVDTTAVITTSLDSTVQAFEDHLQLAQFSIELVAAQLLLVAGLAVAFISGHALERQRHTFAVWRSRGWSWHAIWRLLILEVVVLALPALPAGLVLAWLTSVLLARRFYGGLVPWLPPVQPGTLLTAVALGLGVAICVMAAQAYGVSRRDLLEVRREASRPALRGWWQRRGLDLGLAAVSLPLLAATRLLGQSDVRAHGAGGDDPVSLALPGLALILLGVALLRLLPLAGALGGLVARRLPAVLASLQLTRRPVQHAGLTLLIIVTTALGIFASVYESSEPASAADRAAYAVGSDIRAHFDGDRPPLTEAVASLEGVQAASFVYRGGGTTAVGSGFQPSILAVDPYSLRPVVWSRPDLAARPLPDLVQELADRDRSGLELPGHPDRVAIWVSSSGLAADLQVDLTDTAGRPVRADLGSLNFQGWLHLEADLALASRPVRYPLRLRDLAVEPRGSGAVATGTLGLSDLAVGQSGKPELAVVDRFSPDEKGVTDWWRAPAARDGVQLRAPLVHDGSPALRLEYDPVKGAVLVEPPRSMAPIPALAPTSTLARAGLQVGRPFSMIVGSITAEFVVVDAVDHFPTLYPEAEDFMVVAQAPLLTAMAHDTGQAIQPAEAWLRVTPDADAGDAAALEARGDVTSIEDRRQAEAAARRDPVLLELETNLLLGFGAALALTVVSAVVHFLVTVRGRLGEYAILRANGLGQGTILRSLAVEQALLVVFAIVVGAMTGLGLAWALIPALQLGGDLTSLVPPTLLTVDPVLAGAALAAVALVALAAGRLANRAVSRFRLMDELRLIG